MAEIETSYLRFPNCVKVDPAARINIQANPCVSIILKGLECLMIFQASVSCAISIRSFNCKDIFFSYQIVIAYTNKLDALPLTKCCISNDECISCLKRFKAVFCKIISPSNNHDSL